MSNGTNTCPSSPISRYAGTQHSIQKFRRIQEHFVEKPAISQHTASLCGQDFAGKGVTRKTSLASSAGSCCERASTKLYACFMSRCRSNMIMGCGKPRKRPKPTETVCDSVRDDENRTRGQFTLSVSLSLTFLSHAVGDPPSETLLYTRSSLAPAFLATVSIVVLFFCPSFRFSHSFKLLVARTGFLLFSPSLFSQPCWLQF